VGEAAEREACPAGRTEGMGRRGGVVGSAAVGEVVEGVKAVLADVEGLSEEVVAVGRVMAAEGAEDLVEAASSSLSG